MRISHKDAHQMRTGKDLVDAFHPDTSDSRMPPAIHNTKSRAMIDYIMARLFCTQESNVLADL
jgi:hypothetical protein